MLLLPHGGILINNLILFDEEPIIDSKGEEQCMGYTQ